MSFISATLLLFSVLAFFLAADESGDSCIFERKHIPGLSSIVRTDADGNSCRGDILLPLCSGACKTHESGLHVFPYREQSRVACTLIGSGLRNVSLSDCDDGADESIRFVTISAASLCGCRDVS